jgi:hypothetical protein
VYRPSGPVTVVTLFCLLCTDTETLGSGDPSPERVTVPVTVPVPWAKPRRGTRESAKVRPRMRLTGKGADQGCGIRVLVSMNGVMAVLMAGANRCFGIRMTTEKHNLSIQAGSDFDQTITCRF